MVKLQIIKGIECFTDENGMIQLKLENVARGLGFTQTKNNVEYIRNDRVATYLTSFGFSPQLGKEEFIPEPIFYMLAMKAESEQAKKFQKVVAYEILPEIRKTGVYSISNQSKEIQAIFSLDQKQIQLEKKVDDLENNMPLFNIDCEELQGTVRKQGAKILGGKDSKAYKDKPVRTKLYSDIQREIKRQFGLQRSYKALKRSQLEIAIDIVSKYSAPLVLLDEITLLNNQVSFVKDAV